MSKPIKEFKEDLLEAIVYLDEYKTEDVQVILELSRKLAEKADKLLTEWYYNS